MTSDLKVVSLVPSWTETFIEAGVNVVARTRYCIHPEASLSEIPEFGGTKKYNWQKLSQISADVVVMDREENTREMASECPLPVVDTHVTQIADLPKELHRLSEKLQNENLRNYANRWQTLQSTQISRPNIKSLPGIKQWIHESEEEPEQIFYVVWTKPWMVVSSDTFIGSIFEWLGHPLLKFLKKYPEIEWKELNHPKNLLLFASEPYDFEKYNFKDKMPDLVASAAVADGESFSWFGIRSLQCLERLYAPS